MISRRKKTFALPAASPSQNVEKITRKPTHTATLRWLLRARRRRGASGDGMAGAEVEASSDTGRGWWRCIVRRSLAIVRGIAVVR